MHLPLSPALLFRLSIFFSLLFPPLTTPLTLTLSVPSQLPPLPPSTRAILTAPHGGPRIKAPVTRQNTFVFRNLTAPPAPRRELATSPTGNDEDGGGKRAGTYSLDIACRDYDFLSYGVDVEEEGEGGGVGEMRVYRTGRGAGAGGVVGEKVVVKSGGVVEVRVLRGREFYEGRAGCKFALFASSSVFCWGEWFGEERGGRSCGWRSSANEYDTVSPLDLLKNPMILIAVVALALMFGMPYLMDNSMSTTPSSPIPFSLPFLLSCWLTNKLSLPCSSGPRNEEGVRRTAEEEHLERWGEHGESVAELRYGRVDGGEDVGGE